MVAEVAVITDQDDRLAKWAYAADLGGNIYRISGADANTQIADDAPGELDHDPDRLAWLHERSTGTCAANRKFMLQWTSSRTSIWYVILVGSGDREKPVLGSARLPRVQLLLQGHRISRPMPTGWWVKGSSMSGNGHCSTDIICLDSLARP